MDFGRIKIQSLRFVYFLDDLPRFFIKLLRSDEVAASNISREKNPCCARLLDFLTVTCLGFAADNADSVSACFSADS